ncbi:MAG: trypsin-like serine protease [Pirellulales bacterium]|nr:trypsin-like serine protease [Pirellulales bacterium]
MTFAGVGIHSPEKHAELATKEDAFSAVGMVLRRDVFPEGALMEDDIASDAQLTPVPGTFILGSGTLISNHFILTAGHVLEGVNQDDLEFYVRGVSYKVKIASTLPGYEINVLLNSALNDLALLKLEKPVPTLDAQPNPHAVSPIPLLKEAVTTPTLAWIAGYGAGGEGTSGEDSDTYPGDVLRAGTNMINEPVTNNAHETVLIDVLGHKKDNLYVADFDMQEDSRYSSVGSADTTIHEYVTTHGDSGGPLLVETSSGFGVAGVTSGQVSGPFSTGLVKSKYGDLSYFYSVRTQISQESGDVPAYEWIQEKMSELGGVAWWTPTGNGNYSYASSWDNLTVPGDHTICHFDVDNPTTVSFDASYEVASVQLDRGDVTFDLNGNRFGVRRTPSPNDSSYFIVGYEGPASLTITNGRLFTETIASIGWPNPGSVSVAGDQAEWECGDLITIATFYDFPDYSVLDVSAGGSVISDYINVGRYGNGRLSVSEGSSLEVHTSLRVGYEKSQYWFEHTSGHGELRLSGGATANVGAFVTLGLEATGQGTAYIQDPGTVLRVGRQLIVGDHGTGKLEVTLGGQVVSNDIIYSGLEEGSHGLIEIKGPGSSLATLNQIQIGRFGNGEMLISSGSQVVSSGAFSGTNSSGLIGVRPNGVGRVTISGTGSQWVQDGAFSIGYYADGTLRMLDGGRAESVDGFVGRLTGSVGAVQISDPGTEWEITNNISIGGDTQQSGGTGEVTVSNGGRLTVGEDAWIWSGGTMTVTSGGLVSIGGTLTLDYNGDGFINMADGGMLALGDYSLVQFLDLIGTTDAVRYWDASSSTWAPLSEAIYGTDYMISYLTEGNLAGYTLLTVSAVPEPGTLVLATLSLAGFLFLCRSTRHRTD